MPSELREKIATSLCVAVVFGFTLFFFAPAHLYFTNILFFISRFSLLLPVFLGLSFLCALILFVILVSSKFWIHQKLALVLLAVSFLLWLQGNVLVWNYGPWDGREIDWHSVRIYGLIDTAIWITLIVAVIILGKYVWRVLRRACAALIVIQLVAISIMAAQAPDASYLYTYYDSGRESVLRFSSRQNILMIVLDSFQSDVFNEIISQDAKYREMFDGFVYYRNTIGGFPITEASIALILAGRYYDNSMPFRSFVKKAFLADSVPKILFQHGYQVDLMMNDENGEGFYSDQTIGANLVNIKYLLNRNIRRDSLVALFNVTFFRYFPHYLKKFFYGRKSWFAADFAGKYVNTSHYEDHSDDLEFMKLLTDRSHADSKRPTFKYLHLWFPHIPIRINENLEFENLSNTRENYKRQAMGSLKLVDLFFEKLKAMGIYENTMIFLMADHGSDWKIKMPEGIQSKSGDQISRNMDSTMSRAIPLLLVKPFGATGKLEISDAPVSLADIAPTIISELNRTRKISGRPISEISASEIRDRRFLDYDWTKGAYRKRHYLPPMTEYIVSGFGWSDESWHPTQRLFTPDGIERAP